MRIAVVLWFKGAVKGLKGKTQISQQFNADNPIEIMWRWIKSVEKSQGHPVDKIEMFEVQSRKGARE